MVFFVGLTAGSDINCAMDEAEKELIAKVLDGHPDLQFGRRGAAEGNG